MNQKDKKRHSDRCAIAIVGGGFAGSTLTAQLLRGADASLSVVLIDRRAVLGRGLAYSTSCTHHLLNVPAENMSALADDPLHFLRWAQRCFDKRAKACDFLPRRVYIVLWPAGCLMNTLNSKSSSATWGEGLPFGIWRVDHRISRGSGTPKAKLPMSHYLRESFYITTSGNFHTPALTNVILEVSADRILCSVDYPYEDVLEAREWFDQAAISEPDRLKIARTKPRSCFGSRQRNLTRNFGLAQLLRRARWGTARCRSDWRISIATRPLRM